MPIIGGCIIWGEVDITLNPSDKGADTTLSNGNLDANGNTSTWSSVRATVSRSAGRRYFEVLLVAVNANSLVIGICNSGASLSTYIGNSANGAGTHWSGAASQPYVNTWTRANSGTTGTGAVNDVIGIAVDFTAGYAWFARNGTWLVGDPAAGTTPSVSGISGAVFPGISTWNTTNKGRLRTKFSDFTQAVPGGFMSWAAE